MQTAAQTVKVRIIALECPSYNGSGYATVWTIKIRLRSPVKVEECLKNMSSRIAFGVYKGKSMRSLYGGRRKGQISEHQARLVRGKSTDGLSTRNHLCCAQYTEFQYILVNAE